MMMCGLQGFSFFFSGCSTTNECLMMLHACIWAGRSWFCQTPFFSSFVVCYPANRRKFTRNPCPDCARRAMRYRCRQAGWPCRRARARSSSSEGERGEREEEAQIFNSCCRAAQSRRRSPAISLCHLSACLVLSHALSCNPLGVLIFLTSLSLSISLLLALSNQLFGCLPACFLFSSSISLSLSLSVSSSLPSPFFSSTSQPPTALTH